MKSRTPPLAALAALLVSLSPFARAAEPPVPPPPQAPTPPAGVEWKFDGEIRLRGELRLDPDLRGASDDDDSWTLSRVRVGLLAKPFPGLSAYVQLQDSRIFGAEASTTSNEKNVDLHQGYLRIDELVGGMSLQAGRFEMAYGDERLVGAFGWNNVGRSFDGVRARIPHGLGNIDLFFTRIRESPPKSGDGEDADFSGLYLQGAEVLAGLDLYALRLGDEKQENGELAGTRGDTEIVTVGGRLAKTFHGWGVKAEGAAQRGTKRGDDHAAWAVAASVDRGFPLAGGTAGVLLGYAGASGDDGADGDSGEFENLFPTNHPLYGQMDLFGWRNLRNPWARLRYERPGRFTAVLDFHHFSLVEETGAWKDAAGNVLGLDATGRSGRTVGREIDLVVTIPVRGNLRLQAGAARFFPGEFAEKTRGDDEQDWFYLQLTLPF